MNEPSNLWSALKNSADRSKRMSDVIFAVLDTRKEVIRISSEIRALLKPVVELVQQNPDGQPILGGDEYNAVYAYMKALEEAQNALQNAREILP